MDIKKLVRDNVLAMSPYSSARDEFTETADVYLDANENPFDNGYNRYPDPYQSELKQRIAELKGVSTSNILLGNGSDEVLDLIFRVFCEPKIDNVVSHNPSYGMYPVLSSLNDVELRKVELDADFKLNADRMLSAKDGNTKLIFVCSPNNPSGNILSENEIKKLFAYQNSIVVIDEAYIDFAEQASWTAQLDNYPNLIVCQTLSKAWGLAGIRLGMCFASPLIIQFLNTIKPPYNVNSLTQKVALEVLNDEASFKKEVKLILSERKRLEEAFTKFSFVKKIYPSDSNFILLQVDDANHLYAYLLNHKVVVRNRSKEFLCNSCVRITVGTPEQNDVLLERLDDYIY